MMAAHRCWRGLLLLLPGALVTFLLSSAAKPARDPAGRVDNWVEVRSRRFVVYSNAGEWEARKAAQHLERLAQTLERTTSGLRLDGGRDLRIYLFRERDDFVPYSPFRDDEEVRVAGFHTQRMDLDAEYIAYWMPPTGQDLTFASHEYVHAVLSRSFVNLPLWVNEGLAEFYSTFEPRGSRATLGKPVPQLVLQLQREGITPLRDLLAQEYSAGYRVNERSFSLHAQSWALVHRLYFSPGLGRVLGEIAAGTSSASAMRDVYGPNAIDSLQHVLVSSLHDQGMVYSDLEFSTPLQNEPVAIEPLEPAEARAMLAELALATARDGSAVAAARTRLEDAWRADSSRLSTAALLGCSALEAGDAAASRRWFAALDRPGRDADRALGLAGSRLVWSDLDDRRDMRLQERPTARQVEARHWLAAATEARPDAVDWLVAYAATFIDDPDSASMGVGALMHVQELDPRQPDVAGLETILFTRLGRLDAARHAYALIPAVPGRMAWRPWAGWCTLQASMTEVERLAKDGQLDEADSLIARTSRAIQDAEAESRCRQEQVWLQDLRQRAARRPEQGPAGRTRR